jgi:hypothetical protein
MLSLLREEIRRHPACDLPHSADELSTLGG